MTATLHELQPDLEPDPQPVLRTPRPTSGEINLAIEVLRRAHAPYDLVTALNAWNSVRLVNAAEQAHSLSELQILFAGLRPQVLNRVGLGPKD